MEIQKGFNLTNVIRRKNSGNSLLTHVECLVYFRSRLSVADVGWSRTEQREQVYRSSLSLLHNNRFGRRNESRRSLHLSRSLRVIELHESATPFSHAPISSHYLAVSFDYPHDQLQMFMNKVNPYKSVKFLLTEKERAILLLSKIPTDIKYRNFLMGK